VAAGSSSARQLGVVAAGHQFSAHAGADALRAGGNAVDAALAALLAAFTCEPLLTGLGAGGYMLVVGPEQRPVVLDFFVAAPGLGPAPALGAELLPVDISFGDAVQIFNIGPASVAAYGVPAGIAAASARFGRLPLAELTAPAAALARAGVALTGQQAYLLQLLAGLVMSTPECAELFAPGGRMLTLGETIRQREIAAKVVDWVGSRGGMLTAADLEAYEVIDREPVAASFRGRSILTNPPPSAGGILIAHALSVLDQQPAPASTQEIVAAMAAAQAARTPEFIEGLHDPEFVQRFRSGRLGSTTHVAVLDADGMACSMTTSSGASSGVIVPGTGIHLNNMLGEQDLNPLGFHQHRAGMRLPSMMAPTVVLSSASRGRSRRAYPRAEETTPGPDLAGGVPELVLGSAGSNRIRSAILQTIVRVLDDHMHARAAVDAPRLHFEDGVIYTEPGIDLAPSDLEEYGHAPFHAQSLFFGGVQAVECDADGWLWGGGDPRRGGAAIVVAD
jgi:gamma-glutamyltranspeptidase/glutathione hydrolase